MTLYDEGLELLRAGKIYFAERFIPYFFASYACHCFNLRNILANIYYEHRGKPDMRLHTLMVAPPGFSKSIFMRQLFDPVMGILNTPTIEAVFEGSCTEAGFIGTIDKVNGQPVPRMGLAQEYQNGIVAIEEFAAITKALEQKHSATFEAQLNSALFGGEVRKRLAGGLIKYHTNVTLIAGTQTTRFDISGGLGRRFSYIYWVPTRAEFQALRDAVREGANVQLDQPALENYRNKLLKFQSDLDDLKHITYTKDLYDVMAERPHFEFLIYRKIALGYNLFIADKISSELEIGLDARLKSLIVKSIEWRNELLGDPEASQVLNIIKEHGGVMMKKDLLRELVKYSVNWQVASLIVEKLKYMGKIRYNIHGELEVV